MKAVLITGATGGIGFELCNVFAKHQNNIVLLGQDDEKLVKCAKELELNYKIKTYCIAKDLSKQESAKEVFEQINKKKIEIDVLCNNAGFGDFGDFLNCDLEKNINMINVNIMALMQLTRLFGEQMKKKGYGKILNTASIGAFQPGPLMSVYYATKAFVLSFSEALAKENEKTGVDVCCLCPGTTQTKFFKVAGADLKKSKLLQSLKPATPKAVAEFGYKNLMKNKAVAIHGFKNRFLIFCERFLCRKSVRNLVYKLQNKRK